MTVLTQNIAIVLKSRLSPPPLPEKIPFSHCYHNNVLSIENMPPKGATNHQHEYILYQTQNDV